MANLHNLVVNYLIFTKSPKKNRQKQYHDIIFANFSSVPDCMRINTFLDTSVLGAFFYE